MPIRFRQDVAAVIPPSNQSTRKYGQSLVLQQQQQKYAGQQAGYDRLFRAGSQLQQQNFLSDRDLQEQRARDFDAARARLDTYARDMLANGEITDPEARRKIQGLIAGKTAVMGSGFDQTARQEYLDQYNAQLAGILSSVPVKPTPTPADDFNKRKHFDKDTNRWYLQNDNGRWEPIEPQEQPGQQPQQPKTFGEYFQMEPDKARKALDDKMAEIRDSISVGDGSLSPYKSVEDKALAELDKPFRIMQDKFGKPTQASPSAGALPAPTDQGQSRSFTYQDTPDVGSLRGAQPTNNWFAAIEEQVAGGRMTPQQIAAMNAETDASLAQTDAVLADNQARGRAVADQYAPRTEAVRRDANVLAGRNARAESAMRGELGPRAPEADPSGPYYRNAQGKPNDNRVNSTYSISGAQADREAEQFAKNKAEYAKYKTQRAANDAKLTGRATNRIVDPKQLKRDSQQFSADYQLYKRGGGTLSTRDYIMQRAAQGTLSDDLTRQLQENYGMDLTSSGIQGVVEQDVTSQRGNAMSDAKAKRDAEETRKRRARGLPPIQQAPPVVPPVPVDTTRPTRGLPGGPPTRPAQTYVDDTRPTRGLPGGEPTAPAQKYVTSAGKGKPNYLSDEEASGINERFAQGRSVGQSKTLPIPKATEPNFRDLEANAQDDTDKTIVRKMSEVYKQNQSPEVRSAIGALFGDDPVQAAKAADYLQSVGIDLEQLTAEAQYKGTGRGQIKTSPANNSSVKYGVGRGGVRTK